MPTQSERAIAAARTATRRIDPTTVAGWGVDADPRNDPTWPMRDRSGEEGRGAHWARPPQQTPGVEILRSVEHEHLTASVGTTLPPRGLSGALRRRASRFSESQWGHWLLLILADRVDTVEGLVDDLRRGRPPNPRVEMGVVPRSRSREAAAVTGLALGAAVVGLVLLARRRR